MQIWIFPTTSQHPKFKADQTAIAQAENVDKEQTGILNDIKFKTVNDKINTTNLMIEAIENLNHLIQPTNYIKEIDFIKELKNDLENERKIVKNEIFENKIIETKKVINLWIIF